MVENIVRQTSKKTLYQWSFYLNIILFFIVAIFVYLVVKDAYAAGIAKRAGTDYSGELFALSRDVAILAISLAIIFIQLFRNLWTIMKRSL
jgi:hypothetical protein